MKAATGLSALCASVAVAVLVAMLVAAGAEAEVGAGAGAEGRSEADAWAVVAALSNVSDAHEEAVRESLKAAARRAATDLIARLQEALALDDAELKLAEAEAEAALKGPQQRSMGGGGSSIDAEAIRRILTEGLQSQGIPPLDPYRVSYVPINADIPDVLSLQASIEDLRIEGLSSFEENIDLDTKIGFGTLTVDADIDVLIPRLRLVTDYEADASLDVGLDIWGDGVINLALNRLRVKVRMAVRGAITNVVRVEPCDVDVSSRGIKLEIEGLFGGGLLSELVGEIISDMVNDVLDDVLDLLAQTVEDGVCGYLRSKSTIQLIALLRKITSMPLPDD